jgi:hypothetical protein
VIYVTEEEFDQILLRIPVKLKKKIDEIAKEERRDRTAQIIILIEKGLKER